MPKHPSVISLVPSITKSLLDLGLPPDRLLGRTKFCIHPAEIVKNIPIIGGTKNLQLEKIRTLHADLIIANKEENERLQIEELMRSEEVWLTEVSTLRENEDFLDELVYRCHLSTAVSEVKQKLSAQIDFHSRAVSGLAPGQRKAAYLIWKNPWMAAGGGTFIDAMLTAHGLVNVFGHIERYPVIQWEELQAADVVFLSSEPYPFKEKHRAALLERFPGKQVSLVNGEYFSWFGTHPAYSSPDWTLE